MSMSVIQTPAAFRILPKYDRVSIGSIQIRLTYQTPLGSKFEPSVRFRQLNQC